MEDDRVSLLEQQLAQAKLIAEEADKKYEEVGHEPANEKTIFLRRSYGSQSVSILTNHDPFYHFRNKFLFDIFYYRWIFLFDKKYHCLRHYIFNWYFKLHFSIVLQYNI